MTKAILALADGTTFVGESFGAETSAQGEVCFNTSMTGYQEILTDPSYTGQIVTLTYPEIGNYGVNLDDIESDGIKASALIVKNYCPNPSNYRSGTKHTLTLSDYLKNNGIPGLMGIDTRKLVRILREKGAQNGVICIGDLSEEEAILRAKQVPAFGSFDFVKQVSVNKKETWSEPEFPLSFRPIVNQATRFKVVAMDYGVKHNILRILTTLGVEVVRLPANSSAAEILSHKPDGLFLSNGPGDPEVLTYAVDVIKELLGKLPIFGICLGHQLISLALGGKTFKLKFGHRGANHPVKNLLTGTVEITSQNHGYSVDPASLDMSTVEITHINLNDQTVSGLRHRTLPIFSVQYHPEASPGPKDSHYLFEQFTKAMEDFRGR